MQRLSARISSRRRAGRLSSFPMNTLRRELWPGYPVALGEGFRLRKDRGGREFVAVCSLRAHELGWELVLDVGGELQRSEVCRTQDQVLDLTEKWKAALLARGWSADALTRALPDPAAPAPRTPTSDT
jgi:hypothetical protein